MNAIELSHVTKHFPGFTLQDLSLTVPSGTICGLVGENGAGKSTTIRLLMGALRPDSGTCTVLGADSAAPEFLSLKEDIGVVLDEAYFPESLNALQVGGVMAKTYRRWDGKQYQNYLTRFGLPEKKPFKDFSRGMKMKLAIAVALSHSPRQEDHSILISSHILSDLEKLCDYIAFLHQGRLLFCDEKDRLLEEYGIFVGTADQVNSLQDGAVVARENSSFGGVRCLVKRALVPAGWALERPTVEDIVLFLVKGAKEQ